MKDSALLSQNTIRTLFSQAMSAMYRDEVPQYERLISLVKSVNDAVIHNGIDLSEQEVKLLEIERHGAIRVGTAEELNTPRRLFAVMGMHAVDYYDLSVAGIPVHSTAFRAISPEELLISPFRVFTSLLRLDLIDSKDLRESAKRLLSQRSIFSVELIELIELSEQQAGLNLSQTEQFIAEALGVFRWHQHASIDKPLYDELNSKHRLIADVVSFKGPHINHLTPRVLDIDALQEQFGKQGFKAKSVIEGPPKRRCPILLRQTSFIALEEAVIFKDGSHGTHTARFGEVEHRGVALSAKGRILYDSLLNKARNEAKKDQNHSYIDRLESVFTAFPDSHEEMHEQGLAYYSYSVNVEQLVEYSEPSNIEELIKQGVLEIIPILYEDFLPVSAAGIFNSNLVRSVAEESGQEIKQSTNQVDFEAALGVPVLESFMLYEKIQQNSLKAALVKLNMQQL